MQRVRVDEGSLLRVHSRNIFLRDDHRKDNYHALISFIVDADHVSFVDTPYIIQLVVIDHAATVEARKLDNISSRSGGFRLEPEFYAVKVVHTTTWHLKG